MTSTVPVLMLVIVIKNVTSGHQVQVNLIFFYCRCNCNKAAFLHLCCFPTNRGKSSVSSYCISWTACCIAADFLSNGTGKALFRRPGFTMLYSTNASVILDFKIQKLYGEIETLFDFVKFRLLWSSYTFAAATLKQQHVICICHFLVSNLIWSITINMSHKSTPPIYLL